MPIRCLVHSLACSKGSLNAGSNYSPQPPFEAVVIPTQQPPSSRRGICGQVSLPAVGAEANDSVAPVTSTTLHRTTGGSARTYRSDEPWRLLCPVGPSGQSPRATKSEKAGPGIHVQGAVRGAEKQRIFHAERTVS